MHRLTRWLAPTTTARAHCDLPCGVYDPEQARIEAESCFRIMEKYQANTDETFRARAIGIKEERAELVKHHLDVLWHDYFKPEHLEKVPNLHDLFWKATKAASKVKASVDPADGKALLDLIDEVDAAWKATGGEEKTQGRRPAQLTATIRRMPAKPRRTTGLRRVRGPWRIAVAEAQHVPGHRARRLAARRPDHRSAGRAAARSSSSTNPTAAALAVKRVAAGPGDRVPFAEGYLELAEDEAWLLSDADATEEAAARAGFGVPIDSRRYGPVPARAPRRADLVPLRAARPDRADPGGSSAHEREPLTRRPR